MVIELFKNTLNGFHVLGICGANELVMINPHQLPEFSDTRSLFVHKSLGRHALFLCHLFNLLSVLVNPCNHVSIVALKRLKAFEGICRHSCIGMADMQVTARVIDGRCNIILFFQFCLLFTC